MVKVLLLLTYSDPDPPRSSISKSSYFKSQVVVIRTQDVSHGKTADIVLEHMLHTCQPIAKLLVDNAKDKGKVNFV